MNSLRIPSWSIWAALASALASCASQHDDHSDHLASAADLSNIIAPPTIWIEATFDCPGGLSFTALNSRARTLISLSDGRRFDLAATGVPRSYSDGENRLTYGSGNAPEELTLGNSPTLLCAVRAPQLSAPSQE
jgi:hypothetical protein